MARYNEILAGRYNRALQKLLGMKGEPPAPQLSTEIQTNFRLPLGVEFRYLESWNRYGFQHGGSAQAGLFGCSNLRNPASSGGIVVVERIRARSSTAQVFNLHLAPRTTDQSSTSINQIRLDARTGTQGSIIIASTGTVPFAAGLIGQGAGGGAGNTDLEWINYEDEQITILPGDCLQVDCGTLNTDFQVVYQWRERQLEESERA